MKRKTEAIINYYSSTIFMLIGLFLLCFSSFQLGVFKEQNQEKVVTNFDKLSAKFDSYYGYAPYVKEYGSLNDINYQNEVKELQDFLTRKKVGILLIGLLGIVIFEISARFSYYYLWIINDRLPFKERIKKMIEDAKDGL